MRRAVIAVVLIGAAANITIGTALALHQQPTSTLSAGAGPSGRSVADQHATSVGDFTLATEVDSASIASDPDTSTTSTTPTTAPIIIGPLPARDGPAAETPITASPPTTTAPPAPPITPPTTAPSTTPQLGTAHITVRNDLSVSVTVTVGDENNNAWTLAPGDSAGPWDLITTTAHGDGASVTDTGTACGAGDGENYFLADHTYLLVVTVRTGAPCLNGDPNPLLVIEDLTTGTSRTI